jgi:DNA-binding Lrp family transcriptional regulator
MADKQKLLIVSYSFPPLNTVASKRWYEMIPELSKVFDIQILTSNANGSLELDAVKALVIHSIGTNVNEKRSSGGISKKGIISQAIGFFTSGIRTIDSTIFSFYFKGRPRFDKLILEFAPDYIITSVGPFSTSLFGRRAKIKKPDIKWIVDLRDAMSLLINSNSNWLSRKIDAFIDKSIIGKADLIITVSPTLKKLLAEFYSKDVGMVLNGYKLGQSEKVSAGFQVQSEGAIYYAGMIYEHRFQALVILLNYLKCNTDKYLVLRLVNVEMKDRIEEMIEELSLTNVKLLESVDDKLYQAESRMALYNLVLEDMSLATEIGKGNLTAKLFNLLQYDPPILTIARNDSDIGAVLKRTGKGEICDSMVQLEQFFSKKREEFKSEVDMSFYSRQGQAKEFMKWLNG